MLLTVHKQNIQSKQPTEHATKREEAVTLASLRTVIIVPLRTLGQMLKPGPPGDHPNRQSVSSSSSNTLNQVPGNGLYRKLIVNPTRPAAMAITNWNHIGLEVGAPFPCDTEESKNSNMVSFSAVEAALGSANVMTVSG